MGRYSKYGFRGIGIIDTPGLKGWDIKGQRQGYKFRNNRRSWIQRVGRVLHGKGGGSGLRKRVW